MLSKVIGLFGIHCVSEVVKVYSCKHLSNAVKIELLRECKIRALF